MLTEIEKKTVERLKAKGLNANLVEIDSGKKKTIIKTPAVLCHIESGKLAKVGNKIRVDVDMYLSMIFRNFMDEEERRKGIYPIIEGTIGILSFNKLGLDIGPLVPVGFNNVTNEEDIDRGLIVFYIHFRTFYYIEKIDDEEAGQLLTIGIKYYLQEPEDDGNEDAGTVLDLRQ